MARDYTGRIVKDTKTMSLGAKIVLLTIGILFLLAAITAPLVVLMSRESRGTVSSGDFIYQYNIDSGNVYYDIKKYIGQNTENVVIPSEYNGAPVIGILKGAFNGNSSAVCKAIKKVSFDTSNYGGISRIDSEAFVGLTSLQSLDLPSNITTIDENAFLNCKINGDVSISDLGAFYDINNGVLDRVKISTGAFNGSVATGSLNVLSSKKGIVPSEILKTFGTLGVSKLNLSKDVNIYNLGFESLANFNALEEMTIYTTSKPVWVNGEERSYIIQDNLDLSNCTKLKTLNINFGSKEDIESSLTQKFLFAPNLETVNIGNGVTKIGAKAFASNTTGNGFEKLKTINVDTNIIVDENGVVSENKGISFDVDMMKISQYTSNGFGIYFANSGKIYKFNNSKSGVLEETSVMNKLKITRDTDQSSNIVYLDGITQNFMSIFKNASSVRELIIDSKVRSVADNALVSLFTSSIVPSNYKSGEGFTLRFLTNSFGRTAIDSQTNSLSDNIFGNLSTVEKLDVYGPNSDSNSVLFNKFNRSDGAYKLRHTYNDNDELSNLSYIVSFDTNMGDNMPGFNGKIAIEANYGETTNGKVVYEDENGVLKDVREQTNGTDINNPSDYMPLPYDVNKDTNEWIIEGWYNSRECLDSDPKLKITASNTAFFKVEPPDGTDDEYKFSYVRDENHLNIRTLTVYAKWVHKPYINVSFDLQPSEKTTLGLSGENASYYPIGADYGISDLNATKTTRVQYNSKFNHLILNENNGSENIKTEKTKLPVAYQAGYIFKGWFTLPNGEGTQVSEATTLNRELLETAISGFNEDEILNENYTLTLYAYYEVINFNVVYHAVPEKVSEEDTNTFASVYGNLVSSSEDKKLEKQFTYHTNFIPADFSEIGFDSGWLNFIGYSYQNMLKGSLDYNYAEHVQASSVWSDGILGASLLNGLYDYTDLDGNIDLNAAIFKGQDVHLYCLYVPKTITIHYEIDSSVTFNYNSETNPDSRAEAELADVVIYVADDIRTDSEEKTTFEVLNGNAVSTIEQVGTDDFIVKLEKIGYTYAGKWQTEINGETEKQEYNANDEVSALKIIADTKTTANNEVEITLSCMWNANSVSVYYDKNDGLFTDANGISGNGLSTQILFNENAKLSDGKVYRENEVVVGAGFSRTGCVLVGWSLRKLNALTYENLSSQTYYSLAEYASVNNINGEELLEASLGHMPSASEAENATVRLYAVWQYERYNLQFIVGDEVNSGYTEALNRTVTYGQDYQDIDLAGHNITGKIFAGFYTGENGTGTLLYESNNFAGNAWKALARISKISDGVSSDEYKFNYDLGDDGDTITMNAHWTNEIYTINYEMRQYIGDQAIVASGIITDPKGNSANVKTSFKTGLGEILNFEWISSVERGTSNFTFIRYTVKHKENNDEDVLTYSNPYQLTFNNTFIETYASSGALNEKTINIYVDVRAKVYEVDFKVDGTSDYGTVKGIILPNSSYADYISEIKETVGSEEKTVGFKAYVVLTKTFGYLIKTSYFEKAEDNSTTPATEYIVAQRTTKFDTHLIATEMPTITLTNGNFMAFKLNGQNYTAKAIVENQVASSGEDLSVINVQIVGTDYNKSNLNIQLSASSKSGETYKTDWLAGAFDRWEIAGTYAEGGIFALNGTTQTIPELRQNADITLTVYLKNGFKITKAVARNIVEGPVLDETAQREMDSAESTQSVSLNFVVPYYESAQYAVRIEIEAYGVKYQISYNGGAEALGTSMQNSQFRVVGSEAQISLADAETYFTLSPNTYSRLGYSFLGWDTEHDANNYGQDVLYMDSHFVFYNWHSENGIVDEIDNITTTENAVVNLYAVWGTKGDGGIYDYEVNEAYSYTVKYNGNPEAGAINLGPASIPSSTVAFNDETISLEANNYVVTGYANEGKWYYDSACTHEVTQTTGKTLVTAAFNFGQDTESRHTVNLYTKWIIETYVILFDANGGSMKTIASADGNFEFGSYTFYVSDEDDGLYDTTTQELVGIIGEYNSNITLPTTTKNGYTFLGWYNKEDNDNGYDELINWSVMPDIDEKETNNGDKTITLYARWQIKTYTIILDLNATESYYENASNNASFNVSNLTIDDNTKTIVVSGTTYYIDATSGYLYNNDGTFANMISAPYGTTGLVSPLVDNKLGFTFVCWCAQEENNNGKGINAWVSTMPDLDAYAGNSNVTYDAENRILTLYASWQAETYAISYIYGGTTSTDVGTISGISDNIKYENRKNSYNITEEFDLETPSRTGHTFAGWFTDSDCTAGNEISRISHRIGAITVYAKFEVSPFAITYLDEGGVAFSGTHESGYPVSHSFGAETTLKGATKVGYRFDGWFIESDCSGTALTSLGATDYNNDITLYAKWTALTLAELEDKNGNSISLTLDLNVPTQTTATTGLPSRNIIGTTNAYFNAATNWNLNSTYFNRVATNNSIVFGEAIGTLPEIEISNPGYTFTFLGWNYTNPQTSEVLSNQSTATIQSLIYNFVDSEEGKPASITMVAQWSVTENTFTLKINFNGAEVATNAGSEVVLGSYAETTLFGGTFDKTEGTLSYEYSYGDTLDCLDLTPYKLGSKFICYCTDALKTENNAVGTVYSSSSTMPADELTLYAIFSDSYYEDAHNEETPNEGKYQRYSINYVAGTPSGALSAPTRPANAVVWADENYSVLNSSVLGFTFNGYSFKSDLSGNLITAQTFSPVTNLALLAIENGQFTEDNHIITLYASFSENVYSITYHANYVEADPETLTPGSASYSVVNYSLNNPTNMFARTGYTISSNWYYDSACENEVINLTDNIYNLVSGAISAGQNPENSTSTYGGQIVHNLHFYAGWTLNVYNIEYKDQGGNDFSGTHINTPNNHPTEHTYGTITTLNSATKDGYEFKGWFSDINCTGEVKTTIGAEEITGDPSSTVVTLYAKWALETYNIIYKDKGNIEFSGSHENGYPQEHTFGTATALKTASKVGYKFNGWFIDENCTGTALTELGATAYTSDITLYALWEAKNLNDLGISLTLVLDKTSNSLDKVAFANNASWTINNSATSTTATATTTSVVFDNAIGTIPTATGIRAGYIVTLLGYTDGTTTYTEAGLSALIWEFTESKTFTAIWSLEAETLANFTDENGNSKPLTFTLDLNNSEHGITASFNELSGYTIFGSTASTQNLTFNSAIGSIPSFTYSKTGYIVEFLGWKLYNETTAISETIYTTQQLEALPYTWTHSVTAKAQWNISAQTIESLGYTFTIDLNEQYGINASFENLNGYNLANGYTLESGKTAHT
ncbi:MAG: InlB B-repeat-containing protein, partial [Clostridia bacterium]|nr:InlB B-repeat-containing protein [Clostridia bacterium]